VDFSFNSLAICGLNLVADLNEKSSFLAPSWPSRVGKGIAGRMLSSGRWSLNIRFSNCVWPFAEEESKRTTISLKKAGLVYDLLEKI
jgi:hypothetical protein